MWLLGESPLRGNHKVITIWCDFVIPEHVIPYIRFNMSEMVRPRIEDYSENDDYEQFFADMEEYNALMKIQRFEKALKQDYGIDEETWNNTPLKIQKLLADMHNEAENHHYIMEELECWRDNMPI